MKGWCFKADVMCKSSCVSIMRRRKERMTKDCEFNRAHPSLPPHTYPSCAQVLLFALLSFFFFLSFLLSFTSSCTALSSCNTKRTKLHHHHLPSPHCSPSLLKHTIFHLWTILIIPDPIISSPCIFATCSSLHIHHSSIKSLCLSLSLFPPFVIIILSNRHNRTCHHHPTTTTT